MSNYYTPDEVTYIASQLLSIHENSNSLPSWYKAYSWKNESVESAWQRRKELQHNLLESEFALNELQAIHQWGFNNALCVGLNNPVILTSLQKCLRSFQMEERPQQERSLATFLDLQREANAKIGLARVSKWICFVDQARFAILDSRVSRGLYRVRVDQNHRAFPVLAGRVAGPVDPMAYWTSDRLARMYLDYLAVIQHVAKRHVDMQPAQVEMALFMIGQPALTEALNPKLRKKMWC